ncbi:helix-turn-helix domain-containing protein [Ochrobactrum intermedium]|nr:helix-turn-helix domain-containing protein [Brucella intermedia]
MAGAMSNETFISIAMVEVEARNDFWREATRPVFDTMPLSPDSKEPLEGAISSRPLGSIAIGTVSFNGQRYIRDHRTIVHSDLDYYLIQLFTSGKMNGDFNGLGVRADVGDICFLDLSKAFKSEVDAGSRISLAVSRRDLEKVIGPRSLHGVVLRGDQPMTRLIATYLKGIRSLERSLSPVEALASEEALIALLAGAVKGDALESLEDYPSMSIALRQRVLAFIDQNIGEQELSPELIQQKLRVSRSHLYRAFAEDGGVAKIIRDRRLDEAFKQLAKPSKQSRSVSQIAYSLGFSSGNQLLRGFRARFDMTPKEAQIERERLQFERQANNDLHGYFTEMLNRTVKS